MNKKSKRITLGLVSALCLLLVVALGFGVTGAWYRARREATGTVKLDKGIILTVTDLDQFVNNSDPLAISSTVTGNLWVLNANKDGLVALTGTQSAVSTQPGVQATKNVVIPTIGAAANSTSFYAKAKLVFTFQAWDRSGQSGPEISSDTLNLSDLYTTSAHNTNVTLADIFSNELEFNNMWDEIGSNGYYMYTGAANGDASTITLGGNATAAIDAGETVALFTNENVTGLTSAAAGKTIDVLTLDDWTIDYETSGDVDDYVEFGGPKFYDVNGDPVEIAQINIQVIIDVIQSENLTADALSAWKAAE